MCSGRLAIGLLSVGLSTATGTTEDCAPPRRCGYTVRTFSDALCTNSLTVQWIEPGSCTAATQLSLGSSEESRNAGGNIGDIFSVGGVIDAFVEGIGYWYSPPGQIFCDAYSPKLYYSASKQSDSMGDQNPEGCNSERCLFLTLCMQPMLDALRAASC